MNRIKRIFGFRNVLERAWAETQVESPDTVMLASYAEAAEAMEAMRQAAMARIQGEQRAPA
ncbi:MAG: hypothetical protein JWP65_2424 [Ramlibacter sp.]|jgi:hypothetical protein|uniref:hypothetical protein n=1 Tax=Ramlibacter sp. TaxID=1917967 RepID=UPI00260E264D|nr:hypothetical protein [Ramlibacter sp.]MDB5752003.1 hypothetical protein [Ramlibacter sp.]